MTLLFAATLSIERCLPSSGRGLAPPRTAHRTGTAARETQGPSRSYPALSTELEREVEDSAGLRDLEGQLPHSSRQDINRHLARLVWPWGGRVGSVSLGRDRDG